ncbi:SDR family NAD(P)-dependent oxidoreductase [Microbaculum sp. FT89]|uniref:SDR family NAD(P)-dependent oxidoreductase n=1 Tax=Microbaculum sp. FT89 TaxID=3447298 RepID=UPI003F537319
MRLEGQAAFVTGGGSGLGAAVCRRFAREGARVAVVDRDPALAAAIADEIGGLAIEADVADAAQMEQAFAAATSLGPLRACVACAGVGPSRKILSRERKPMPLSDFQRVIDINLNGTFNTLRLGAAAMADLEAMEDGERGVVVMTASIAGHEGQVGQAAYAASKAGVMGLALPAARELARHGIRVAAVAPGVFSTPMFETVEPAMRQSIVNGIPWPKRGGDPEEFADMVAFIVANRIVNGTTFRLDGAVRLA